MNADGLSRREAWALSLVATLTMAVSYVDRQTLSVLAPSVTQELGFSETAYGTLQAAFALAYLIGAPLAGHLVDRVGARRGLVGAVLVWSVVAALHGAAPAFGALFLLRIALGLAEAPSFPSAAQVVHRVLPREDQPRGFGILFTGSSIGSAIAPPLAAACAVYYGWRVAFLLSAVVGLVWVPLWIGTAFRPRARAVLDRPAKIDDGEKTPSMFEVALHPAMLSQIVLILAAAPAITMILSWGSKYLVHDHHLTQGEVGLYLWFPPVVFDIGSVFFGDLAARRRRAGIDDTRVLVACAALLELALAGMPFASSPIGAIALAGVALAGGGGLFALGTSEVLARIPSSAVARAGGISAAAQSVAQIVFNPLVGHYADVLGSYELILITTGLWVLPGAAIWIARQSVD
jgi:ACS family hexuronate transporter-like MFS transporter